MTVLTKTCLHLPVQPDCAARLLEVARTRLCWPVGSRLQQPELVHLTLAYARTGRDIAVTMPEQPAGLTVATVGLDRLAPDDLRPDETCPVVVPVYGRSATAFGNDVRARMLAAGVPVVTYGDWVPHVTIGFADTLPAGELPVLPLRLGPLQDLFGEGG